ncbi:nucleotidyltransferase family protein [Archangium violaceum]|uniref:nucleotidyltransferase family protein n=1 Tax=Archangium violaceum TaxID=83451 RepID=UPI0019515E0A|nr:nucleotidyltransferase family protein [Archangium violaceum]QRN95947.1 nucleotidyltransferase family protein [Archangium violaceum]
MSTPPNTTGSPLSDVTAVLLCGGKGERLRPFTEHLPKPLVPLRGKPLLQHLLRYLSLQGVRRFVLCTGYKAEAIVRFVEELSLPLDLEEVVCVDSGEDANMADRVLDARRHVPGRALICYGDTLANVDLGSLARHHADSGALATMTVYPLQSPYGIVSLDGDTDRVSGLLEKPVLPYWINIGFILCEPAALDEMRRGTDLMMFLGSLTKRGAVRAHKHQGKHLTVNTEKERTEAEGEIEFFTLLEGTGT